MDGGSAVCEHVGHHPDHVPRGRDHRGDGPDHLTSSPIHGVWVQSAERVFDFTFRRLGFEAGNYFRMQKVHGQITVNEAADEYTGRQVSEMYDLDGKLVVGPNPVMNQARRITVESDRAYARGVSSSAASVAPRRVPPHPWAARSS